MFSKLGNVVHFVFGTEFQVARNLSLHGFLRSTNNTRISGETGVFAVIDYSDVLKLFTGSCGLFRKYKQAAAHNSMSFYTMQGIWLVQKNFVTNIFARGVASLVEAGVYGRWRDNGIIAKERMSSYLQFREQSKESVVFNDNDAEATAIDQVRVPFVLYLGLLGAAGAVFLKEIKIYCIPEVRALKLK